MARSQLKAYILAYFLHANNQPNTSSLVQFKLMKLINSPVSTFPLKKSEKIPYVIDRYIGSDGERFSFLCEKGEKFPLFYPTAYCSRSLRPRYMPSSQIDHLYAIKMLYTWANNIGIDIHARIETSKFFAIHEYDSLVNWISLKKNSRHGDSITGKKINTYLDFIANYLSWYADEVITDSNRPEVQNSINNISNALKIRHVREESPTRKSQVILKKKLSDEMRASLTIIFSTPFLLVIKKSDHGPAYRNALALRTLYETGMRIGELLSLKLRDFQPATGSDPAILNISRNHDDPFDNRIRQPVAKTSGRPIPINSELSEMFSEYLKSWRSKVPNAGFDDHDFIFINHRKAESQGQAMEYSTFMSAIATLKKKHPNLRGLHPHLLRHDWNYRFSMLMKELGVPSIQEQSTREFLMGWVPGSQSASRYNRRHIQESAFEYGLQTATLTAEKRKKHVE